MAWQNVFDLAGMTENQRRITAAGLDRCNFDWELLLPGLKRDVNKTKIPIEWADLSRYSRGAQASADGHDHDDHPHTSTSGHVHVKDESGRVVAHGILYRSRVLGLAWYSGKVSLDTSLETKTELAHEVLIAEGAHMADFFYMTPAQRAGIWKAYHAGSDAPHSDAEGEHGWFEELGNENYWDWVGESFMIGFLKAFTNIVPTLDSFTHKTTTGVASEIRRLLQDAAGPSSGEVFSNARRKVFHDKHRGITVAHRFASRDEALSAGLVACRVCKP